MTPKSPRGFSLVLSPGYLQTNARGRVPRLTVELYIKWYSLFLVSTDGKVEEVLFPNDPIYCDGGVPYVDHVPNPIVVARFAEAKHYHMDDLAMEMIVGRWEIEVKNNYF